MHPDDLMNILMFILGAFGCAGVVFAWPATIIWFIFMFVGWGALVFAD